MSARRRVFCVVGVLVLGFAWYLFRPELLFIDRVVSEGFPGSGREAISVPDESPAIHSNVLAHGTFHSVAHDTAGAATIYRLEDGRRLLRLTDFATSNGPDVRVILVAADDASDSAAVTQSAVVELGPLKGNKGNQNYAVPSDVDLDRYRAVTIWCHRFSVNFATAPLKRAG